MTRLSLRAPAKINLNLRILGRRPDGYHDLESVVQTITLHDTLTIGLEGDSLALVVDAPGVPAGPENLVWRAAEKLLKHRAPNAPRGVLLTLTKRIPAGAGLGGGSSDAAATLVGLDRLLGLGLPPGVLQEHAAALGSDVPFFLTGGTAVLGGRGTEVLPLDDLPPRDLLIVHPGRPLSTAAVYAQVQEPLTLAGKPARISRFGRIPVDLLSWVRAGNDLEPHAERLCPDIVRAKAMLASTGAVACAMTGSGSAVFGVYDDAETAAAAALRVPDGFQVVRCRTLDRAAYHRDRVLP
jgi:4-diphosphocytidyl-2-C-methyl-D-erythritol kinase